MWMKLLSMETFETVDMEWNVALNTFPLNFLSTCSTSFLTIRNLSNEVVLSIISNFWWNILSSTCWYLKSSTWSSTGTSVSVFQYVCHCHFTTKLNQRVWLLASFLCRAIQQPSILNSYINCKAKQGPPPFLDANADS